MYKASCIGLIVTILCMLPNTVLSVYITRKRKKTLLDMGIDEPDRLSQEDKLIVENDLKEIENDQETLHVIYSLSLFLVYPAIIANAIFRVDVLKPWFVFLCCFLTYSGIALLIM